MLVVVASMSVCLGAGVGVRVAGVGVVVGLVQPENGTASTTRTIDMIKNFNNLSDIRNLALIVIVLTK
jgi:hypothetical protein